MMVIGNQRKDGQLVEIAFKNGTRVDTYGSAGIAATLALGVNNGMLSANESESVLKAFAALQDHLTEDGLLILAAQSQ